MHFYFFVFQLIIILRTVQICETHSVRQHYKTSESKVYSRKDTTFFQFGPDFSYNIFHQKGATLSIATDMFLS